ncbi:MAG: ABC transporter substrate-binding protein [bacterium]
MKKIKLLLERKITPHHLPFIWAREKELFKKNEIELELIEPVAPFFGLDRLVEEKTDMALSWPLFVLDRYFKKKNITSLARLSISETGFFYRQTDDLQDISDINSKHRISYRGGSKQLAKTLLKSAVERAGGATDLKFNLASDSGSGLEKLINGEVDLLFPGDLSFDGVLLNIAATDVGCHFFTDANLPGNGELILCCTNKLVEDFPNVIQKIISVLHTSTNEVKENSTVARELFLEKYPDHYSKQKLEMLWQSETAALTGDFPQSFNLYTRWGEWIERKMNRDVYLDLDNLIDERFLPFDLLEF